MLYFLLTPGGWRTNGAVIKSHDIYVLGICQQLHIYVKYCLLSIYLCCSYSFLQHQIKKNRMIKLRWLKNLSVSHGSNRHFPIWTELFTKFTHYQGYLNILRSNAVLRLMKICFVSILLSQVFSKI